MINSRMNIERNKALFNANERALVAMQELVQNIVVNSEDASYS